MKKRFMVALNSSTPEQDQAFKAYVNRKNLGWWHWISNVWLLYSWSGAITAVQLRDDLDRIYPNVRKIVLELSVHGDTWAGFGPTGEGQDMFEWIKANWKPS